IDAGAVALEEAEPALAPDDRAAARNGHAAHAEREPEEYQTTPHHHFFFSGASWFCRASFSASSSVSSSGTVSLSAGAPLAGADSGTFPFCPPSGGAPVGGGVAPPLTSCSRVIWNSTRRFKKSVR